MKHRLHHILEYARQQMAQAKGKLLYNKEYHSVPEHSNQEPDAEEKQHFSEQLKAYQHNRPLGPQKTICFAPTRSLYFGFGGKVIPCCFNRDFEYGRWPDMSVDEIIHSAKRQELQQELDNRNFDKGCQHCRRQIISGNFSGVEALLYDTLKSNPPAPSEMIFELDNTCNLACVMCDETFSSKIAKEKHLPQEKSVYDERFAQQLEPWIPHLKIAKFLGGEPFLVPLHYNIWEKIITINPKCIINLQTNGTVYMDKIEKLLQRGRFQIGVSIDSLQKERFEQIRKHADFDVVMANLNKFIAAGRKSGHYINISVCPMQQNRYEIPELVQFCNDKGVFVYFNTVYTKGYDLRELSSQELEKLSNYYESKLSELSKNSFLHRRNRRFFKSLTEQIKSWHTKKHQSEQLHQRSHRMAREAFYEILAQKLDRHDLKQRLYLHCVQLPENIMLSTHQIEMLKGIESEDLQRVLSDHDDRSLKHLLHNFLEEQEIRETKTYSRF
ncbi:MAG: radical SAM protein [Bacteroidales bacterium]